MRRARVLAAIAVLCILGLVSVRPIPAGVGSEGPDGAGIQTLKASQVDHLIDSDPHIFILDVRRQQEISEFGALKNYVNIPVGELQIRLDEVPSADQVLPVSNHGERATVAAEFLIKRGFRVPGVVGIAYYIAQGGKKYLIPPTR